MVIRADASEADRAYIRAITGQEGPEILGEATLDRMRKRDLRLDMEDVERGIYDPIKNVSEGGVLGILESGLYGMPNAIVSSTTAAIPGLGAPLTFTLMREQAYADLRRTLIAQGIDPEHASQVADEWRDVIAIPQAALEKIQAKAVLGKLPFAEQAVQRATSPITNLALRAAARGGAATIQETVLERGQDFIPVAIQNLIHQIDPAIPGAKMHNGKDGYLDGWWARTAETAVAMAPLSFFAALGGVSGDVRQRQRVEALQRQRIESVRAMSDTQLAAFGLDDAQRTRLRAALDGHPTHASRVMDETFSARTPYSDEAKAAVETLSRQEAQNTEAARAALPSRILAHPDGGFRVIDTRGEEIGRAPDPASALRLSETHAEMQGGDGSSETNPAPDTTAPQGNPAADPAILARAVEDAKTRGNIANTDDFRSLVPGYNEGDPLLRDHQYFKPAADLNYAVVDKLLAEPPATGIAVVLAGGGGSGKTTVLEQIRQPRDLVIDTTFSSDNGSKQTLASIENSGRDALVIYVHRPFHLAFEGVIRRYLDGKEKGNPRLVPLPVVAKAHVGAQEAALSRSKEGARVYVYDNSGQPGDITKRGIDFLEQQRYVKSHASPRQQEASTTDGQGSGSVGHPGDGRSHPSPETAGRAEAESRLIGQGISILEQYRSEGKLTDREFAALSGELQEGSSNTGGTEDSSASGGTLGAGKRNPNPGKGGGKDAQTARAIHDRIRGQLVDPNGTPRKRTQLTSPTLAATPEERAIVKSPHEIAIIHTADGTFHETFLGDRTTVHLGPVPPHSIATHNHPGRLGFSGKDLEWLFANPTCTLRVVTQLKGGGYEIYQIRIPDGKRPALAWEWQQGYVRDCEAHPQRDSRDARIEAMLALKDNAGKSLEIIHELFQ